MARTVVLPNESFDRLGIEERDRIRMSLRLKDGQGFDCERAFARGHPNEPLSKQEVFDKVGRLADGRIRPERMTAIIDQIMSVDSVKDVGALSTALSTPPLDSAREPSK